MKEIILPHGVGDTTVRFPSVLRYDQKLNANLLIGFLDAAGDLQPYIPVGGSVNALPAPDTPATPVSTGAIGAGATGYAALGIDMTEWDDLILDIYPSANMAIGEIAVTVVNTTHRIEIDTTGPGAPFAQANSAAVGAGVRWLVRFERCGGVGTVDVAIVNGNAAVRTFTVTPWRYLRRHG